MNAPMLTPPTRSTVIAGAQQHLERAEVSECACSASGEHDARSTARRAAGPCARRRAAVAPAETVKVLVGASASIHSVESPEPGAHAVADQIGPVQGAQPARRTVRRSRRSRRGALHHATSTRSACDRQNSSHARPRRRRRTPSSPDRGRARSARLAAANLAIASARVSAARPAVEAFALAGVSSTATLAPRAHRPAELVGQVEQRARAVADRAQRDRHRVRALATGTARLACSWALSTRARLSASSGSSRSSASKCGAVDHQQLGVAQRAHRGAAQRSR